MSRYTLSAMLVLIAWIQCSYAADVDSGPAVGDKIPPLKVHAVTGRMEGVGVDYPSQRQDAPTVYVLFPAERWDRPLARFLRKLDEAAGAAGDDTYVVAVWLTNDAETTAEYLPRAQQSLNLSRTAFCSFSGAAGPDGWALSDRADVTVVVAISGKVLHSAGYVSPNESLVPAVAESLRKSRAAAAASGGSAEP